MRELPEAKRKVRVSKSKPVAPFTKGTGLESDLGRGYVFGLETRREEGAYGPEYRTRKAAPEPRYIPPLRVTAYGLPCAGCGISRPLAATDGGECEYCGTIFAATPGARIYVEG